MTFTEAVQFLIYQTTRFVTPPVTAVEWVLAAFAAGAVALAPFGSKEPLRGLRRGFHRVAASRGLAIAICGLLPVAIRLSMLGFAPVPDPSIHDEFSHLLLGDTLAHGRLTNPTHPMWRHFESIHIIQRPTYNSMYPPGQGAFLALGEVVFHEPWAGVVISVGLMCAAVCWMMQGWLAPPWALFGGLIVPLKIGVTGLWMNSYLGGAVAGIGGALVTGALPRLTGERPRWLHGSLFGIGLVVLMNTRPFEGALLGLVALVYAAAAFRGRRREWRLLVWPAAVPLACGLLFTGYYSWRVTGSPLKMPYQVNRDTYGWPENLAFLPPKEISSPHPVMRAMHRLELQNRERYSSPSKVIDSLVTRLFDNWTYFIGPLLTIPLLFLPLVYRNRRTRPLVVFLGAVLGLNLFQLVLYPFHLGPVVGVIYAIVAEGCRYAYSAVSLLGTKRAVYFACALPVGLVLIGAVKQESAELGTPMAYWERASEPHGALRADVESWLSARPGGQLVIVRYTRYHPPQQEWVYNRADIDGSKVVWAREMDAPSNQRLLQYFAGREAWLVEADRYPQRAVRYKPPPETEDSEESSEEH
jgi:hypothetical protein